MSHDCHCGKPIQDTANLCPPCVDQIRTDLHKIADRWAELEDALRWRLVPKGEIGKRVDTEARTRNGERKLALATGSHFNEQASHARRKATDAVFFTLQVIRDDMDETGRPFTPPRNANASQDATPAVARWVAAWQLSHISHHTSQESAEEIARDLAKAERATFHATHPSGERWVPVNLACEQHGTSDEGERVPCEGHMWALVGKADTQPDLVCDADQSHILEPASWERSAWKRRRAEPMDPRAISNLLAAVNGKA